MALWEFIAFIANSLVFLLIGVAVERIPYDQFGIAAVGLAIGIVLLARRLRCIRYVYFSLSHVGWFRYPINMFFGGAGCGVHLGWR